MYWKFRERPKLKLRKREIEHQKVAADLKVAQIGRRIKWAIITVWQTNFIKRSLKELKLLVPIRYCNKGQK